MRKKQIVDGALGAIAISISIVIIAVSNDHRYQESREGDANEKVRIERLFCGQMDSVLFQIQRVSVQLDSIGSSLKETEVVRRHEIDSVRLSLWHIEKTTSRIINAIK